MIAYKERSSSREKDLVDLVVFATIHNINGAALRLAIEAEARRRQMEPFDRFAVPAAWGAGYAKLSKPGTDCAEYRTVALASDLAKHLIDPALSGEGVGRTWSHEALSWD